MQVSVLRELEIKKNILYPYYQVTLNSRGETMIDKEDFPGNPSFAGYSGIDWKKRKIKVRVEV